MPAKRDRILIVRIDAGEQHALKTMAEHHGEPAAVLIRAWIREKYREPGWRGKNLSLGTPIPAPEEPAKRPIRRNAVRKKSRAV